MAVSSANTRDLECDDACTKSAMVHTFQGVLWGKEIRSARNFVS